MRSTHFTLTALPLVAQAIDSGLNLAAVDDNRAVELPGILKYPIKGVKGSSGLTRRQTGGNLPSQNHGLFYTIGLNIGTPGTAVEVQFDTGSSELWVNPVCSRADQPATCQALGRLENSSSIKDLHQSLRLNYGRGYADIEYYSDFVQVGSAKLANQIFGAASDSQYVSAGILGTGPDLNGINNDDRFVVNSLHKQGFTKSIAFGVDLQGIASARGSVVFGGADLKKFRGTLHTTPIIPRASTPDGYARYWVNLDGIAQTAGGKTNTLVNDPIAVFLDTGSTISYFPPAVVQQLLKGFPGAKATSSGGYQVDCSLRNQDASVDFKFGDTVIKAAYKDFIYEFDPNSCLLGFTEDTQNSYLLGDSFLRSAYVVFDQTNQELSIAQADDCGTHLVAVGPGPVGPLVGECGKPPVSSTTSTTSTTSTASHTSTKTTSTEKTTSTSVTKTSSTETASKTHTESETKTHTKSETKTHTKSETKTHTKETSTPSVTSTTGTATKPTITSTTHWGNTTTASPTYTSTFTTTKVYTITSCPPTVTNCPVGHITTEIITSLTTWCPGENPQPTVTTTVSVPGCPGGHHCPPPVESTPVCPGGENCPPPAVSTPVCPGGENCAPVVSTPEATTAAPAPTTEVIIPTETGANPCPGCNIPTSGVANPTGGLTTVVVPTGSAPGGQPTAPVTAGATKMGVSVGVVAFMVAAIAML